jgi:hypothetical protein
MSLMLQSPALLESNKGHGIRPFGYKVEFAYPPDENEFVDSRHASWQEKLVQLDQVTQTYGSEAQTASIISWDPDAIDPASVASPEMILGVPKIGQAIRITVKDEGGSDHLIFKGTIMSVHSDKRSSGVTWRAEAVSEIQRLSEPTFTGAFNPEQDPVAPHPYFDGTGKVLAKKYTVKEIITEILRYPDAWGTQEYFQLADIDWNGLDTDVRCGGFKPESLVFDNTPKGKAIEETLQRAGNFTFLYVAATDKIRIIELNRNCTACGSQWPVAFASTDAEDATNSYAYQFAVAEDKTEWSSTRSANVCRIMTGPIQFYSGHSVIPERATGTNDQHVVADDADDVASQKRKSVNADGNYYRLVYPTKIGVNDTRKVIRMFAGMPLFPDWNIFEDFMPAVYEIGEVQPPYPTPQNFNADQYRGKVEFQPFSVGDQIARGETHLGKTDNLRSYGLWFCKDVCPGCNGWGAVRKIYSNAQNEPNITFVLKGPTGAQRYLPEVTNYIFKPSDFGTPGASPSGLSPFFDGTGAPVDPEDPVVVATGGYPLPWKNTCPFCRGVGMKPEFRIRNLSQGLFRGRNLKVAPDSNSTDTELPADPDAAETGPETWEEANNRMAHNEGPVLQVEVPVSTTKYVLPSYEYRNRPFTGTDSLATLTDGTGGTPDVRVKRFPHPLQFSLLTKNLLGLQGVTIQAGDVAGRDKIAPPSWYATVPFTTIYTGSVGSPRFDPEEGRVLFQEPVFIPCTKNFATINTVGNKARVDTTGLLATGAVAGGCVTADARGLPTGFWRHARVWMMFNYEREHYFNDGRKAPDGSDVPATEFSYTSPEGQSGDFEARASIVDGRYCLDVRKKVSDDTPQNIEIGSYNRIIPVVYNEPRAVVQVHEVDFWKMPVPPSPDVTDDNYDTARRDAQAKYVYRKLIKWERTTNGEALVENAGWSDADHYGSLMRPKAYRWRMQDDRPRLLGLAARRLDAINDLQVQGTLKLVGPVRDVNAGLGYVDYPDRGKAAVVRVTYNFSGEFSTELELHREETRLGELPPADKDKQNRVERELATLRRSIDVQRAVKPGDDGARPERSIDDDPLGMFTGGR